MTLRIEGLTRRFGATAALAGASLEAPSGAFVALLGPSGSGKTTLLRILGGLDGADTGQVDFEGIDWLSLTTQERRAGFVFQNYALFRHMTVAGNVGFGLRMRRWRDRPSRAEITRRVEELLSVVQLEGLGGRYPSQLSGGQRQRVALARALAIEPRILLLDEPFGALDAKVRKELRRWLRDLHDRTGVTTVFVTHDQEEALDLADIVAVMNKGVIEQAGAPRAVFDNPATAFVAEFIGGAAKFEGEVAAGRFAGGGLSVAAGIPRGPAVAFVRPHDWTIAEASGLEVKVLNVLEAGPLTRLDCRSREGTLLEVVLPPGSATVIRGETLRLTTTKARVFPR
ncbi:Sulfate/thiosulfate import ATP-binding protein CysA [Alphaproteobacteria bacterium SO-S41]|nr:Sulfate/thiosulfate import ATP-binding protein CysA [Alphaproteobacteria bacterium SO-S41]